MERLFTFTKHNFTEDKPTTEVQKLDTFIIRGHHLNKFMDLLYVPPNIAASNIVGQLSRDPDVSARYAADVRGTTEDEQERFETNVGNTFSQFLELTRSNPNYPVKLVVGQKDGICDSCIGGDHCTLANGYFGDAQYDIKRDTSFLDTFEIIGTAIGNEVNIQKERIRYGKNQKFKVTSLTTTVKGVMNIFEVVYNMGAIDLDFASEMLKGALPENKPPTKENLIAVCKAKIANMQKQNRVKYN